MREETRGEEPDRAIWLYKVGEGANESAAERFKRELSELIKEKNTAPEQEDEARPSPLRHSPRRPSPPPACTPPAPPSRPWPFTISSAPPSPVRRCGSVCPA